ncbi:Glycosyl hydrolases family 2, TIM barrel domain [Salinimicrobium sediminis]|uniref:Glycosyl hydrolases family 2, TIM barrel domain n=2 Tax=Salinimicrobium sediminis TaxID=1343891 RepID=A0A285X8L7_9FLAO|nr:Glycosyl hydrolases family 2, TIM barrel domain [Salinimicrobium sediminis]
MCSSCENQESEHKFVPAVHISKNKGKYQLIRNGEPFYMHGAAAHKDFLEELKDAGANTARIYDTIDLKSTLDKAQLLGLAAVVDIPMPKEHTDGIFYEDNDLFEEMYSRVARVVTQHKDHPALLYWNLGNELYYPYFYKDTKFYERFNILIDLIHELDPDHPVSTTTIGANKLRVLSIELKSPQLDFISFNSFGSLSTFTDRLKPIAPLWNGPHVITEWGVNGPWEAPLTSWGVPIEETSTKKAEQIIQRYRDYIKPLKNSNSLGSFVFYWGQKNEITPTWYSLFEPNHLKSQAVFELAKIWKGLDAEFPGPQLEYILLNEKGALDDIILAAGQPAIAEIFFDRPPKGYTFHWEIREESWYAYHISQVIPGMEFHVEDNRVRFEAPVQEGPYRLHLMITNNTGYYATANIPFYVLNPANEE